MENSITINSVTYDFIAYYNPENIILGSGQNCHKCDINLLDDDAHLYCKMCSILYVFTLKTTNKKRLEHYLQKRNK